MGMILCWCRSIFRGSYLVTIEWKGLKSKTKPLAFVGKGVALIQVEFL